MKHEIKQKLLIRLLICKNRALIIWLLLLILCNLDTLFRLHVICHYPTLPIPACIRQKSVEQIVQCSFSAGLAWSPSSHKRDELETSAWSYQDDRNIWRCRSVSDVVHCCSWSHWHMPQPIRRAVNGYSTQLNTKDKAIVGVWHIFPFDLPYVA